MTRLRMAVSTAALTIFFGLSVQATPPSFTTLQPGQFREIEQDLTVNIVFVGYGGALVVDQDELLQWLPGTYRSINQAPSYFGGIEPTGNKFTFNYNIVTAPQAFSDAYFNYLNSIAVPESRTFWQNLYNEQSVRSLDVGQNYKIDSIMAERWLAENYKPVNADFSQFDRDNLSRFMTAAYINHASAIAAQILESPRAGQVTGLLSAADTQAGEALTAYQAMDYVVAATRAKAAYENVVAAAHSINVHIEPFARAADTNTLPPFAIFYGSVDDLGTFRGRR